ncbi:MAG: GNAT family N-acetyltransferase [Actinomycetota bacterium]|jgi:predicted GNAT superfamily acetyltransferase
MGEPVLVRALSSLEDVRAAASLFDRIWEERRVIGAPLLRAMAAHGGQVLGAFRGGEMIGALVGLVGLTEDARPVLHSHITGVAPGEQHLGVGFLLKQAQREWCLDRGIDVVTWTMDPMVARNARFNLHKLGAVADTFHRDYYGPMDDAFNRGDRSDRLEIRWELRAGRVERAMEGRAPEPDLSSADERVGPDGQIGTVDGPRLVVRVPPAYHALRETDPQAARTWRDAVADALEESFAAGYVATGFAIRVGYVLERG